MTIQECYDAMGGDYQDVLARLRSAERIQRFLYKILEDKSFDTLTRAMAAREYEEAFRAAHTLKGISLNLSMTRLYDSSNELTEALRGQPQAERAEALFKRVEEDYALAASSIAALKADSPSWL